MKQIKFRAWDENMEQMINWETIEDEWNTEGYFDSIFRQDHYKCMQYIGLDDVNHIEIYEGDIVRVLDSYAEKGCLVADFIGFIKYGNGSFYVSDSDETYSTYRLMDLEFEVIGNIYEDSELLIDKENEN